jgi:hypothetical protein
MIHDATTTCGEQLISYRMRFLAGTTRAGEHIRVIGVVGPGEGAFQYASVTSLIISDNPR